MSIKFLEGLSLVLGMCALMHAFFNEDGRRNQAGRPAEDRPARRASAWNRQAAYMAVGSTLLVCGLAEVMLRGM